MKVDIEVMWEVDLPTYNKAMKPEFLAD